MVNFFTRIIIIFLAKPTKQPIPYNNLHINVWFYKYIKEYLPILHGTATRVIQKTELACILHERVSANAICTSAVRKILLKGVLPKSFPASRRLGYKTGNSRFLLW